MNLDWTLTLLYGSVIFFYILVEIKLFSSVTLLSISSFFYVLFAHMEKIKKHEISGTTVIDGVNNKYAAAFCFTYLSVVSNPFLKINV